MHLAAVPPTSPGRQHSLCRVEVAVRLRPLGAGGRGCVAADEERGTVAVSRNGSTKRFQFDHVFGPTMSNGEVFAAIGRPLLTAALDGYNATLFAYGQTGAGKTHTIMGPPGDGADPGVVIRLVRELFSRPRAAAAGVQFSMLEIYNEQIRDLFSIHPKPLRIREDPDTGPFVEGLSWYAARNEAEMERLLAAGATARTVRPTHNNLHSSRAHTVIQIALIAAEPVTTACGGANTCGDGTVRRRVAAKLCLVDLAGSERNDPVGHSHVAPTTFKEGTHINRSLSCLGQCINALVAADKRGNGSAAAASGHLVPRAGVYGGCSSSAHVPFRNGALTWLLRESIGGNSKVRPPPRRAARARN